MAFRWCAAARRPARAWWAAVFAAITSFEFVFAFFHAPLCAIAPADGSAGSDAVCRSSATVILSAGGFHRERTRRAPAPPSARGMPNGSCDQSCSSARRRCASGLTGRGAGDAPLCGGTPGLSMIVRGSVPKPIPGVPSYRRALHRHRRPHRRERGLAHLLRKHLRAVAPDVRRRHARERLVLRPRARRLREALRVALGDDDAAHEGPAVERAELGRGGEVLHAPKLLRQTRNGPGIGQGFGRN